MPVSAVGDCRCVLGPRGVDVAPDPGEVEARFVPPSGGDLGLVEALRNQVSRLVCLERSSVRDDRVLALEVPRVNYGGAQGLAEAFGCALQYGSGEHWWALPALDRPEAVRTLKIAKGWAAKGWVRKGLDAIRFARAATAGRYPVQQPVTCGPLDLATFVLGYQSLLEALYTHPKDVHLLLRMIVDVLATYIAACRGAAEKLVPDHVPTVERGYTLCSEVRAVLSREHYKEFEERALEALAEAVGPLSIHSCGDWSRHVPAMVRAGVFAGVDIGLPEMDWPSAAGLVGGAFWVHAHPSSNTHHVFADWGDFFYHFAAHMRPESRVVVTVAAANVDKYNAVYERLEREAWLPPQVARIGRLRAPGGASSGQG